MKRERSNDGIDFSASPDLSCKESLTFLDDDNVVDQSTLVTIYFDKILEEEHVRNLIVTENAFGYKKHEHLVIPNWVLDARLESIQWVLRTRGNFGFQPRTAYLSMIYFDRFLSLRAFPANNENRRSVKLLSVACLSLAAKMEELKTPSLKRYANDFSWSEIPKAEIGVLQELEWMMNPVTPFAFLDYIVSRLCQNTPSDVNPRIAGFLLSIMSEINLMHHRPSAIAAAATILALDQKLTRESLEAKINSIPDLKFLEIETVFFCYNLMRQQELRMGKPRHPKFCKTN